MLAPFLSTVFSGLLATCSFLKFLVCVLVFEKSLLRDNPWISPQECDEVVLKIVLKKCLCEKFCFEQVLKISTYSKKTVRFPLDNAIPLLRNS